MSFRIYTVSSGCVKEGATVGKLTLKGAGIEIPAILVGEQGRGRRLDALPVDLPHELYALWQEKGSVTISAAEVGQTKAGKPKLFARGSATSEEKIICVLDTKIGYRGANAHTGDCTGWRCRSCSYNVPGETNNIPDKCPECEEPADFLGPRRQYTLFPGEQLACGQIAQGAAGRMGSGQQIVALIPKDTVFRTAYSGRLYGGPSAHYYVFNGSQLISATWEERVAADLF